MKTLLLRYSHINWALADQGLVSGANFLTGIMLARYLGLEEFGRYALAWMVAVFVIGLQMALIISPMMSFGPKQAPEDEPAYYGAVAVQQVVFGGIVFVVVWGGTRLTGLVFPDWRIDGLALPLASAAVAFQFQDLLRRYFFTRDRGVHAFGTDALRYLGQLAVLFWLFETRPMDVAGALWVIAALAVLGSVAALPAVERFAFRPAAIIGFAIRHWHFGKWLLGTVIARLASSQFFLIVAGAMLGPVAVGALHAARNLMGVTHILFQGLGNVMPIRAARHIHYGGAQALKAYVLRMTVFGEAATGVIAAVMFIAPDFWLGLAYGDEYAGYGILLRWWAVAYLVNYLHQPLVAALRATEQTRAVFVATAVGGLASIVLAYPLIELYGVSGAAAGISIVLAVEAAALFAAFRRRLETDQNAGTGPVAVAAREDAR